MNKWRTVFMQRFSMKSNRWLVLAISNWPEGSFYIHLFSTNKHGFFFCATWRHHLGRQNFEYLQGLYHVRRINSIVKFVSLETDKLFLFCKKVHKLFLDQISLILNFSWARIWKCLVCLSVSQSVCHLKTLGQAGDFKNGPIWLKFCTVNPWVNPWVCFFIFPKFWFLGAWLRVFHCLLPNWPPLIGYNLFMHYRYGKIVHIGNQQGSEYLCTKNDIHSIKG